MSVNSKMTALADKIRVLSGTEDAMSLNAMENHVGEANTDVATEAGLIEQIVSALEGKAVGGVDLPELTNEGSASDMLSGKQLIDSDGNVVTGNIPTKSDNDLTVSGATVTVPSGYYASQATKSIDTATQATPSISIDSNGKITATATQTAGYVSAGTKSATKQLTTQAAKTITPSITSQIAVDSGIYTTGIITIDAMPATTQATPNITVDSNGKITASTTQAAGYVVEGTKSATKQLTTQAAKTITPSTSSQIAVAKDVYTTGVVTVGAIPSQYIVPSGTLPITSNGTYDVKNYASATVSIESSGGGSSEDTEILSTLINGTITSYSNDTATSVRDGLFMRCTKLTSVSFPAATKINQYAFYQCSNLTTVSFPACTSIGENAFALCSNIVNVELPACKTLGMSAFGSCYKLVSISLPQCTSIANYAIARCSVIKSLDLPACQSIGVSAFRECPKLATVSMPAVISIPAGVFSKCFNLKSLYLMGSSLCTLSNSNAFASTPIGGYSASAKTYGSIYVPASMLASYQVATNWTYFSNRMVGI